MMILQLRARALRAAGELGRVDLKPALLEQVNNQNPVAGFWAAWSVVLLGGRGKALSSLQARIIEGSDFSLKAMSWLFVYLICKRLKNC